MKYGLSDQQLKEIKSVLASYSEVEEAILFGSRTLDTYKEASDVDIVVKGAKADWALAAKLKDYFEEETYLPFFFDIIAYATIGSEELKKHIRSKGETVFSRSAWREVRLGDYIKTNKNSIGKNYPFSNILYLDTGSITVNRIDKLQEFSISDSPSRAKRLVEEEDIIYSSVRPNQLHYGFIKNPKDNLVVSTGFVVINCNRDNIYPLFLFYYLSLDDLIEYLHSIADASTSAYPSLKPQDIESLRILLPPLSEQKAIAEVLGGLDDKIDLLHRQNKTLEQMAETLFRQWFIEEAREGWEEGVLGDEFDFLMGQSPKGGSFNEEGIGIPMYQGNADFDFRFPNRRVYTTEAKRLAQDYDTLISVRAPVGEQNMAREECCIGRGVASFRYKENKDFYTYTYYKIRSMMNEIKQFNNEGTVFGSISKSDVQALLITIPPKNIVIKFQNEVKPIDDKVIKNSIQIHTLEKMRDILLPKLMNGEIKV